MKNMTKTLLYTIITLICIIVNSITYASVITNTAAGYAKWISDTTRQTTTLLLDSNGGVLVGSNLLTTIVPERQIYASSMFLPSYSDASLVFPIGNLYLLTTTNSCLYIPNYVQWQQFGTNVWLNSAISCITTGANTQLEIGLVQQITTNEPAVNSYSLVYTQTVSTGVNWKYNDYFWTNITPNISYNIRIKYVSGDPVIINEFALQQPLLSQGIGSVLMPVINNTNLPAGTVVQTGPTTFAVGNNPIYYDLVSATNNTLTVASAHNIVAFNVRKGGNTNLFNLTANAIIPSSTFTGLVVGSIQYLINGVTSPAQACSEWMTNGVLATRFTQQSYSVAGNTNAVSLSAPIIMTAGQTNQCAIYILGGNTGTLAGDSTGTYYSRISVLILP